MVSCCLVFLQGGIGKPGVPGEVGLQGLPVSMTFDPKLSRLTLIGLHLSKPVKALRTPQYDTAATIKQTMHFTTYFMWVLFPANKPRILSHTDITQSGGKAGRAPQAEVFQVL